MPGHIGHNALGALQLGNYSLTPTTLRTIAAAVSDAIRTLSPDYELFQDRAWTPVSRVVDVESTTVLRAYCCEWSIPSQVDDGIYGDDSVEYVADLRVFTNYRNLPETDDRAQDVHAEMISADGNQLWITLIDIVDPVTDGMVAVHRAPEPFTFENVAPGETWGAHQFTVRMLLSH